MSHVLQQLVPIPSGTRAPSVRQARRLLNGSYQSVDDILFTARELEKERRNGNSSPKGRRAQREIDLLRAALVFSSAGVDASMKRLVSDAGRVLIQAPDTGAHRQFREFLKQALPANSIDSDLRDILLRMDVEDSILSYYLAQKTKASFQGSKDLKTRVLSTLGLPASTLPDSLTTELDTFFIARNRIVHHMDFSNSDGKSTARESRDLTEVSNQCYSALNTAAKLINAAVKALKKAGLR